VGSGRAAAAAKSAAATAAAARARGNEIIWIRDKIGFAPVDLLYSESLTKSTKRTMKADESTDCAGSCKIFFGAGLFFLFFSGASK
jgi:hypothetical protein